MVYKMDTVLLDKKTLRKLVKEELKSMNEGVDHEGVKTVVTAAAKLLKATEAFKKQANVTMTNAVNPYFDRVVEYLEDMISNPSSYVDRPRAPAKRVKLRKVNDED